MSEVQAGWSWAEGEGQAFASLLNVDGGAAALAVTAQDDLITGYFQYLPLDTSDADTICGDAVTQFGSGNTEDYNNGWEAGCAAGFTSSANTSPTPAVAAPQPADTSQTQPAPTVTVTQPAPTVTETQPAASAPTETSPAVTPAPTDSPWTVVSDYYQDISNQFYPEAWAILGYGAPTGQSYEQYVEGYACTGQQNWTEVSENGDQVTFNLDAYDTCGGHWQHYSGTDTVSNGQIVHADVHLVS
jgi:hypothetical protein